MSSHEQPPPSDSSSLDLSTLPTPTGANSFFYGWGQMIVRHRWWVIILSIVSVLLSIAMMVPKDQLAPHWQEKRQQWLSTQGLLVDTSVEAFSNPNDDGQIILEAYRDEFGRDDFFMLMVEGDVFSVPFLNKLKQLHQELAQLNIEVDSLGERKIDRLRRVRGKKSADRLTHLKKLKKDAANLTTESKNSRQNTNKQDKKTKEIENRADKDGMDGMDEGDEFEDPNNLDDFGEEDEQGWGDEKGGSVIEEVTSLINARKTYGTHDSLVVGEWCDPMPTAAQIPSFKKAVLSDDTLVGQVVGRRGQHAVILLRAHFMSENDSIKVNLAIRDIAQKYTNPKAGFTVYSSGLPELNTTLKTTLLSTLRLLLMLSIVIMVSVLLFQFRHVVGVIPPMIVVALATLNMFATMAYMGMPVTMLSNILPAFIFCVGIGDSVHLLSVYRDYFREHQNSKRAVVETVSTTAMPVLFTSITTMVGLLSFRFASIPAIQEMGIAGAIGVGAACLHSLLFLPAVLTFNRTGRLGLPTLTSTSIHNTAHAIKIGTKDWLDRFIYWLADGKAGLQDDARARKETERERKRRIQTLWMGFIITLVGCWGISKLEVWHNPLSWLPPGNATKTSFDIMDREVGGTANVQFLITGGDKGIKDLALLRSLEKLEQHVKAYRHPTEGNIIGSSVSVNDIIKETRQALHQDHISAYRLPNNEEELAQLLFLFENTGPDQLRRLASNDLQKSQMTIRLKWLEATSYLGLTKHIQTGIEQFIPQHAKVEPTGSVYTLVSTIGNLLLDLIKSFGAALVTITFIMMLLLRGLKLGLIAMIPNLMPILWLMGMMGFVGIPVDMNNILIASIAIGLAVDDTIHFLHHYRIHYESHHDPYLAIHHSLSHAGRAMVSTSLILTLGFFAYMAADMTNIRTFGLLIGLSALIAMLINLIFAPAILRTLYPRTISSTI